MYNSLTLTPAYRRDYRSKTSLMADWNSGKDFLITDMHHPDDGRYCSSRDLAAFKDTAITHLHFRYNHLTLVHVVKL